MATRRFEAGIVAAAVMLGLVASLGGCAAPGRPAVRRPAAPATQGAREDLDPKARIALDALEPLPALPAAVVPDGQDLQGKALKRYRAGLEFSKVDQYSDAMEEFQAAIKAAPKAFEPRLELGRAALQAGLFDEAHDALDVAVSLRPRDPQAHYLLGLLHFLRENDKEATQELRYALMLFEQDGDRIRPLFYLAQVLERQGYNQAAVDTANHFETLLASHPKGEYEDVRWQQVAKSQAWKIPATRAKCLRELDKPAQAVAAYDAALKLSPDRPEVQLALAETLIDAGDMGRAVKLAESVLARDRHNGSALAVLAATLVTEGRMPELQDRLLAMVRATPSDLVLAQRVATIFVKFHRHDAALEALLLAYDAADDPADLRGALLQVVFAESDFDTSYRMLVRLLKRVGPNDQEPVLSLRDSIDLNPRLRSGSAGKDELLNQAGKDRTQLLALAVLAEMTDRPILSERALRRILDGKPDDLLVAEMLAERMIDQCRWQDVLTFVQPLIDKHNDEAALYRLMGTAYDGLDDFKPAMNSFYEALRRDKHDVQAMWQAAKINDRLGQMEPAVSIYQVIVATKSDFWPALLALVRGCLQMGQQKLALDHVRKIKEVFADVPAVDLCALMAETGKVVPPAEKVAALLVRYGDDPSLLRTAGEAYLLEGDLSRAISALNRLLAMLPDDEDGRLLLATALARRMDFALSREVVRSLLVEHPNRQTWQFAEAELLLQAGQPTDAISILQRMLQNSTDSDQKQVIGDRLIFAWEYAGQYDAAIDYLHKGLADSPKDRSLQTRLLGVLIAAGKQDDAIQYLRDWRETEPDDVLLARLESRLLSAQGADQAAAGVALRTWPKMVASASKVGVKSAGGKPAAPGRGAGSPTDSQVGSSDVAMLSALLDEKDAAAWLSSRGSLGQADATAESLAAVVARQGHSLEAAESQQLAGSQDVEDLARRVQWLFLAGQRAQAELLLMPQIEQRDPELYSRVKRLAATQYKRLGLDGLAVKTTVDVFRANKDASRAGEYANDLAYMWAESNLNLPQAEDLARMAVASDPLNAAYMDTLAWVYYKMGRFSDALTLLQRATAVPTDGADPVLYDHLGDTLWRAGKREQAVEAWRKSIELYRKEAQADSPRADLKQELRTVEQKIQSVESRRQPGVAASRGRMTNRPM